ncbi:unnamed protein product [Trichogramma brassicae]|uniref:Uncharacterized protein n=1 Tax=Trichogramma brassicae TaxID=86971 RepID=A0A6H5IJV2_9HYME|nr:unnamed protein product [Trichogramma brassicae]
MLVKRPSRSKPWIKFMKYLIAAEVVVCANCYLVWRQLNHSQDFRFYFHQKFPRILDYFYSIGELQNKNYKVRQLDEAAWTKKNLW